jgi:hypothetical protein
MTAGSEWGCASTLEITWGVVLGVLGFGGFNWGCVAVFRFGGLGGGEGREKGRGRPGCRRDQVAGMRGPAMLVRPCGDLGIYLRTGMRGSTMVVASSAALSASAAGAMYLVWKAPATDSRTFGGRAVRCVLVCCCLCASVLACVVCAACARARSAGHAITKRVRRPKPPRPDASGASPAKRARPVWRGLQVAREAAAARPAKARRRSRRLGAAPLSNAPSCGP